jgi:hypothetical protein
VTWLAVLASAVPFVDARAARADGEAAPPPPPPSQSEVHLQIGGVPLQPVQRGHDVKVTSDSEGTRLLAVDTTGVIGATVSTGNGFDAPRQEVCVAPCTAKLSPSGTYMIRGWGLTDSPHFGISEQTTDVKVHAGSAVESAFGATSLSVGVLGLIGGATLVPFALTQNAGSSNRHTFMTIGAASLGGGVALVVLGLVLSVVSTTHIYDGQGARLAGGQGLRLTPSGFVF